VKTAGIDLDRAEQILKNREGQKGVLITVLQEIQEAYGFLPRPVLERVSKAMKVPLSKIFGVVTFYAQFHLKPRGEHVIRVCLGTACHVRGGERVLEKVSEVIGIQPGETTEDLKFTLERVACLGACGLAPAMMIGDQTFGRLTGKKIEKLLKRYQES